MPEEKKRWVNAQRNVVWKKLADVWFNICLPNKGKKLTLSAKNENNGNKS